MSANPYQPPQELTKRATRRPSVVRVLVLVIGYGGLLLAAMMLETLLAALMDPGPSP